MQYRANTYLIMNFIIIFLGLLYHFQYQINQCYSKTMTFLDIEHPVIERLDKRYCKNATVTVRRNSRQDPRHYMDMHIHTLATVNNSLLIDFHFYQFLSNRYQPSFIQLHFTFCDWMKHDMFLGVPMQKALGGACPYPPGEYHLYNMAVPYVPKGFPFTKGRIYCNVSLNLNSVTEIIGTGWVDMEIKVVQIRNN